MGVAALVFMMAELSGCALTDAASVELSNGALQLRNVVTPECLAGDDHAQIGDLTIAALPRGAQQVEITQAGLASLVRRRVPALANIAVASPARAVLLKRRPSPQETPAISCFSAARPIESGEALSAVDLAPASCNARTAPALHYDRTEAVTRAAADIEAGTFLGRLAAPSAPFLDTGEALVLEVRAGPVAIERAVTALQPAPQGGAIFVRDANGDVFAVPVAQIASTHGAQP